MEKDGDPLAFRPNCRQQIIHINKIEKVFSIVFDDI